MKKKYSEDNTTKYYDIIYKEWIPDDYTQNELKLIKQYVPPRGTLLDIGCGSGRHIIPLHKQGYNVIGVEPLKTFTDIVHHEVPEIPIENCSFMDFDTTKRFDVIISMWNAFHQLAYTEREAITVLRKMKSLLNENGTIILSFTPGERFTIDGYNFKHVVEENGKKYSLDWSVVDYDVHTKTVTSLEHITVHDKNGSLVDNVSAHIKQRYWLEEGIKVFAKKLGLKLSIIPGKTSHFDSYYVFQK